MTRHLGGIHRHWPLALAIGLAVTFASGGTGELVIAAVATLGVGAVLWLWTSRHRIVVDADGVSERAWIIIGKARWEEIAYCEETLGDDPLVWDPDNFAELLGQTLAQFTARPLRWLVRLVGYGKRSPRFYRGVLTLHGADDQTLLTIEASAGWADVESLFDHIKAEVIRLRFPDAEHDADPDQLFAASRAVVRALPRARAR